jgi:multiple sugar transport system substrate-binding protein
MDKDARHASELACVPEAPMTRRTLLRGAGVAGATLFGSSLLAACGGSGGGATSAGAGEPVTLEFWDMLWGTGGVYEKTARQLIGQYEAANPNVTIKYRIIPWANFFETFSTAHASGTTPDIGTSGMRYGDFARGIAPLNSAVEQWRKDGTAKKVIPAAIEAQLDADGKVTGLPWGMTIRAISYNRKLFQKAGITQLPASLDELREVAKALSRDGVHGFGFCNDAAGGQMMTALMINNGGGLYTSSCGPNLLDDRNLEVGRWVQDLVRDGSVPKAAAGWNPYDMFGAMERGEIAMVIQEGGLFNSLSNGKDLGVLPVVEGFHGDKATLIWWLPIELYESCQNKPAAIDFINWWLANQQPLYSRGGSLAFPVRPGFKSEVPLMRDPRTEIVFDSLVPAGRTTTWPCETGALDVLDKIEGQQFLPTLMTDLLQLKPLEESFQTAQDALVALRA